MKNIKTIEEWKKIEQLLLKKGYDLFQTQFDATNPDGYHARFINKIGVRYEIKTYNRKIEKEIIKYNTLKKGFPNK